MCPRSWTLSHSHFSASTKYIYSTDSYNREVTAKSRFKKTLLVVTAQKGSIH